MWDDEYPSTKLRNSTTPTVITQIPSKKSKHQK